MIRFTSVYKDYDGHAALVDFSMEVEQGETLALIGPSGGGKTTALKLVNGLISPTKGSVSVGGKSVATWDQIELRQSIGYVIQQGGLFPHWSVARNIGVLPELVGWSRAKIDDRTDELLTLVDLDPATYRGRYPAQLSGGEAQRVGVARALALKPKVLLMDEPFGALDPLIRAQLQRELAAILKSVKATTILVTHDLREAFRLGSRVAVVAAGRLEQIGAPGELLENPTSDYLKKLMAAELMEAKG